MKASEKYFITFFFFVALVLVFDFIDFLIHGLSPAYLVPERYFRNKEIYGTLFTFVTYLFVQNKNIWTRVLSISLVTSVLLQARYYLEGYALEFVLEFMAIHFAILLVVSYLGFRYVLDPFLKEA
jgi:hypothetical protein